MSVHLAAYARLRATFWVKGVLQEGQKLGMAILLNTDIERRISRGLLEMEAERASFMRLGNKAK